MMLLVPVLAAPGEHVTWAVGRALAEALLAVGVLLFVARTVLPRLVDLMAWARVPELFPVSALVVALGTAVVAGRLGLSLPLGAFLAGLALSGSRYGHQMFAEVLPLRDAFVAVFFTSIGMLLDPRVAVAEIGLLATLLGLVVVKAAIVLVVVRLVWGSLRLGVMVALALAQIGEFAFVLSRAGFAAGLLPATHEQAFLGAAILTMALTPLLVRAGGRFATRGDGRAAAAGDGTLRGHVLVIGYGTTGRAVARVLRNAGIPFCALDFAADAVAAGQREGIPVRFGDASRRAVLEGAGAARARAAVVAVGEPAATRRTVTLLRQLSPGLRILARAGRVGEVPELESLGADEVVPSEVETSIELFVRLLAHLGVPRHVARLEESVIRLDGYQALRGLGSSPGMLASVQRLIAAGILETGRVMEGSAACGRTLRELALRQRTGATVLNVVRGEAPLEAVGGATRLEAGDQVVLYGPHEAIDKALRVLEPPAVERVEEPGES